MERTARIRTDPPGALVIVNDEEVGVSPVRFNFLFYGDYDLILRKEGYETVKTNHRLSPPWYQYPPFDIVAEALIPSTIHDEHDLPVYTLSPLQTPSAAELTERALELRERSIFESP